MSSNNETLKQDISKTNYDQTQLAIENSLDKYNNKMNYEVKERESKFSYKFNQVDNNCLNLQGLKLKCFNKIYSLITIIIIVVIVIVILILIVMTHLCLKKHYQPDWLFQN